MSSSHAGRANVWFPEFWLRPTRPEAAVPEWWKPLADELKVAETVIDVSGAPGLWGTALRGSQAPLMAWASESYTRAPDAATAANLVQADLIETLCSIGRQEVDMFVLPVSGPVTEAQADGVLMALEDARQDGAIRFLVLASLGPPEITLSFWQPRDGFELIIPTPSPRFPNRGEGAGGGESALLQMAAERRVTIIHPCAPNNIPITPREEAKLVSVGTAAEVQSVLRSPKAR